MKTLAPLLTTLFIGAVMMIEFFFVAPWSSSISALIRSWTPLITAFTVVVGTANLVLVHLKNVNRKDSAPKSILLLVAFFAMTVIGLTLGQTSDLYAYLLENVLNATSSSIFALSAFYVGSSSFRAFRAKNLHATVLLVSGALVMIGRVPIGESISKSLPLIAQWLMDIPNVAGQRGLMIAMGIGFVSQCLRVLVGYSRRHYGATE